jgi:tricorn protease
MEFAVVLTMKRTDRGAMVMALTRLSRGLVVLSKRGFFAMSFALISVIANATAQPGYFRAPAISSDSIVFVAEGDLWRTSLQGGAAQRLTTHAAEESFPAISPDGKLLAFSARYEGPMEVYVMPLAGGAPKRLTYDGGGNARVQGFTPDGKVLYATTILSGKPGPRLFTVDVNTQTQTAIALEQAAEACFLNAEVVFARYPKMSDNVKRYKGGRVQSLWRFNPIATSASAEATPFKRMHAGTDRQPMCWRDRVYFLSDRDGSVNLWSMTASGADVKQHTKHSGWDIQSANLANGRIAYQLGADLRVLDVASGEDRVLRIQLVSDFDHQRTGWIKAPFDFLTDVALSPNGDRVALTARGQVFTTSVGPGRRAEITRASDLRARQVEFSHDGKSVYTFTDKTDEFELWRYPANGVGNAEQVTRNGTMLRTGIDVSPDGKHIAHTSRRNRLFLLDVATGAEREIKHDSRWAVSDIAWSSDGRWLTFVSYAENDFGRVAIVEASTGKINFVTSDRYDVYSPAFASDGKFLYFIADRNLQSSVPSPWGTRNTGAHFDRRGKIYALALTADARWPFLPKDELQGAELAAKPANSGASGATAALAPAPAPATTTPATPTANNSSAESKTVAINFDGLNTRLYEVPVPAGNYTRLDTDGKRLYFQAVEGGAEKKTALRTVAIEAVGAVPLVVESFFEDIRLFTLSQDKKKVLIRRGNDLWVFDAAAKAPAPADYAKFAVNLRDWIIRADPRDEWKQMFIDAWRMHRDFFWDAGMHGADWRAVRSKYEALLPRVTDRGELNDLIAQMVSEAAALHSQVGTRDLRVGNDEIGVAKLGGEFSKLPGTELGFRVVTLFSGDPELIEERSPLARSEVNVQVGDVITHINGAPLDSPISMALALRQQSGTQVLLTVRSKGAASGATARNVIVTPISAQRENELRYLDWERSRSAAVEKAGRGRIGYVHLQAMRSNDMARFVREFFPVFNREGLIVDLRGNDGGNIDSWIVDRLQRKAWNFWRNGETGAVRSNQQDAFRGHVVVLIDANTYSDGETLAEGLKRLGIATLIGVRTSGAGIWLSDRNTLRDNGIARAAEIGVFVSTASENRWIIEGEGVIPNIEIDNLPHAAFNGTDAQLDAAIHHLQDKIAREPIAVPVVPSVPQRAR